MAWQLTQDVEAYERVVRPLLEADPAGSTVALTVLANARAGEQTSAPPLYGWWRDGAGAVAGGVSHTPPHGLLLAVVPADAVLPLVHVLVDSRRQLPGAFGPTALAAQFAATWARATGQRAVIAHAERLYRLAKLTAPPDVPGRPRAATVGDAARVAAWMSAFSAEAGTTIGNLDTLVRERIGAQLLTLWEAADGTPVALAGRSRSIGGMVRVGPVYTPPEHRCRGYGAAVTAHVSQLAVDGGGRDIVLFTDLANPTSNAIYQRLGYRPVDDRLQVAFQPASGGSEEVGDDRR